MTYERGDAALGSKLYRNPRQGVIFGVCAGLAEYFGFDRTLTRVIVAAGAFFAFPVIVAIYVLLGFLLPCKTYTGTERDEPDPVERQVRSRPHDTLAGVRYRFRDLDVRLQRLEKYVTSSRYKLDREFRKLEE